MIAEFSVVPIGAGVSLSGHVAAATRIVQESGLKNELHAMGTVVEGPWDDVMAVIKRCNDRLLEDCERVSITIKIDSRRGPAPTMEEKTRSVERKLRA